MGRGGGEDAPTDVDFSPYGADTQGMSRQHAAFVYENEILYIQDLGSTNGTRINGFTIQPNRNYRLRNGDELEFGSFRVMVRVTQSTLAGSFR